MAPTFFHIFFVSFQFRALHRFAFSGLHFAQYRIRSVWFNCDSSLGYAHPPSSFMELSTNATRGRLRWLGDEE
jgi:hypothetical protein